MVISHLQRKWPVKWLPARIADWRPSCLSPMSQKLRQRRTRPNCQCRNQTRCESAWNCFVGFGNYRLHILLDSVAWTSGSSARFNRFGAGDCRANSGRRKQENRIRFSCQRFNCVSFVRFHCSRYYGELGSSLCTWENKPTKSRCQIRPASTQLLQKAEIGRNLPS